LKPLGYATAQIGKNHLGDRVCWGVTTTDLGTVVETSWSEVTISWDDGHTTSIQHNDMAQVEQVPNKVV
jgi:arylsulfatase A-like enzyme